MAIFKPFAFQGEAGAAGPSYVTANLISYIDPFDSTIGGGTATDLSGNGNTATLYNSIVVVGSKGAGGNSGWRLDNASNSTPKYLDLGLSSQVWAAFTFEAFFRRVDSSQTSEPMIISSYLHAPAPYTNQRMLMMGVKNAVESYILFGQNRGNTGAFDDAKSTWSTTADTDWHHYVVTYDQTNGMLVYVDGTLNFTSAVNVTSITTGQPVYAGGPMGTAYKRGFGNAYMGLTRLYTVALSAAEVSQNYNANKADYAIS